MDDQPRKPYRDAQHYLSAAWTAFRWAHERIERTQPSTASEAEMRAAIDLLAESMRNALRAIEKAVDPTYESAEEIRERLDASDR